MKHEDRKFFDGLLVGAIAVAIVIGFIFVFSIFIRNLIAVFNLFSEGSHDSNSN